jgi:fructose-1,6-bisphosphatase I
MILNLIKHLRDMKSEKQILTQILNLLIKSCHKIGHHIRHCNPSDMAQLIGDDNTSGDHIKLLDKLSQNFLFETLVQDPHIYGIISEEHDTIFRTPHDNGDYIVAFDPLDGSSNIEFNITTGTIFGIYKLDENKKIKSGHDIVLSGYCLYGGITQFVHTDVITGNVKMLRLTEEDIEPHTIEENIRMPQKGKYYSVNQAYMKRWFQPQIQNAVFDLGDKGYSLRYVGSMVADAHRVLMKGGIFMYPSDSKNINGKIRLLYEAYPFAHLIECAGGMCTDFNKNILDIETPEDIHSATPILLGSITEIKYIMKLIND